MKFRAAILGQQHAPLIVDEVSLETPLQPGQVLVKVLYSGICGSQLGEIDGRKGPDPFLPHLLGHEGVGIVVERAQGVRTVGVDDKVVLHWRPGTGFEGPCPEYRCNGQVIHAGWVTTLNEYAVVSENRLTRLPGSMDTRLAPLLGCAVTTGMGVITNDAELKPGESVLVYGAGGVGLNIIQGARLAGAHPIIAVDLFDNRLSLAATLGATHLVNATNSSVEEEIARIVGASGVDIAIDNTGNVKVIQACYQLAGPQGKVILVGVPRHDENISIHSLPLHFGKILRGSCGGGAAPETDIPKYAHLHRQGMLDLESLITAEYSLADVNRAIDDMRSGEIAGRCLIDMEKA